MQAILCRYYGPTNARGARIRATCGGGKVSIPYPHELSGDAKYRAACDALRERMKWTAAQGFPDMVCGLPNGDRVFVFLPRPWEAL